MPPRKRARLPPGVQVWPPGGRSLPPITGAFLIVWFRRVGFVLYSFIIFGRKRSEVWCISNNHSVTDCPYGIFFYPRARLKGFAVHLLKEQQRRRENARSLFSRSNRSEVLLLLLFSSLVKSLLLLISFFSHTQLYKQQKKNPKNDNALGSHRATAEGLSLIHIWRCRREQ